MTHQIIPMIASQIIALTIDEPPNVMAAIMRSYCACDDKRSIMVGPDRLPALLGERLGAVEVA